MDNLLHTVLLFLYWYEGESKDEMDEITEINISVKYEECKDVIVDEEGELDSTKENEDEAINEGGRG